MLFRSFLNLDDDSWTLVLAWLVAALRPRGPYPLLALFAEQGSGKSTVARLLRELVDPNVAPLRAEPKDIRDLMIAANNSWCMTYDNISHLRPWLSDALCRLSTGGGSATRELYSDLDEVIFDFQRPVLLASIEDVATRSDLLDRCLIVWLPTIPEGQRRAEAEIVEAFHKVRPQILGALLDAVSVALLNLPSVNLPTLPRMADFAKWATAAETAFDWPKGTFKTVYDGNRNSANEVAIESSPVGTLLLELLEDRGKWRGSAGELLEALDQRASEGTKHQRAWPKTPKAMSNYLKRLSPNLRASGWTVEQHRNSKKRTWCIEHTVTIASQRAEPSSQPSHGDECKGAQSDAGECNPSGDDANDGHDGAAGEFWPDGTGNEEEWLKDSF